MDKNFKQNIRKVFKFYRGINDFTTNVFVELIEFSIGLIILDKVNEVTNQKINIFESSDFLISTLVYLIVNIKDINIFSEFLEKKRENNSYKLYSITVLIGIIYVTLDLIKLKLNQEVHFNFIYGLLMFMITFKIFSKEIKDFEKNKLKLKYLKGEILELEKSKQELEKLNSNLEES